jgi:hypothetical protein
MAFYEFFGRARKTGTPDKGVHALTFQLQFFNQIICRAAFDPSFLEILQRCPDPGVVGLLLRHYQLQLKKEEALISQGFCTSLDLIGLSSGARDRNRTGTALRPRDFKSLASTNSATRAYEWYR